ncbi:MAG TPA: hypothetical protein VGK73_15355, partial [Polyangiaceae bacterium]
MALALASFGWLAGSGCASEPTELVDTRPVGQTVEPLDGRFRALPREGLAPEYGRERMELARNPDGSTFVRKNGRPPALPQLIVKFRGEGANALTECAEATLAAARSFRTATADASASLDDVALKAGVARGRALLPGRRGLSTA